MRRQPPGPALVAMLQQAQALQGAGQLARAEAVYRQVLALAPDLPDAWYNLGVVQRMLRRYDDALESYRQALSRGVAVPEQVHLNRGVIYSDALRQPRVAESELRAALRHNPRYVPALLNLANLHADLGRREDALRTYERLLQVDPNCWEALSRYAEISRIAGPDDPLILRLQAALAGGATNPMDRASLGFALGRALDACGAYAQAFEAYAAANRDSRAASPPGLPRYDRQVQEVVTRDLMDVFSADWFRDHASQSTAEPIFVCGMFRSGSTLAEQVLASHPAVTSGGELDTLLRLVQAELMPFPAALRHITQAKLDAVGARYLEDLARRFPDAGRVTDKRPDNFMLIGLIKACFPRARIVHTTRNPLDNCLSVYFLHLDPRMSYATDLMDIGHYYREYRRLMAHWKTLFGDSILDFDYDAFVRDPRPATERLLAYCGLEWDDRCLDFHRAETAVRTASVWQVREPLYARSSGRWRNYERQLAPLRAYLADLVPAPGT